MTPNVIKSPGLRGSGELLSPGSSRGCGEKKRFTSVGLVINGCWFYIGRRDPTTLLRAKTALRQENIQDRVAEKH